MLDYINNFITQIFTSVSIPNIQMSDIVEILILTVLIYQLAKRIADTRILTVVKGIMLLLGLYGVLALAELSVLASLFKWFIVICLICIILAIQPDLRKIMESAGSKNYVKEVIAWWKRDKDKEVELEFSENTLEALIDACEQMSKTKTGALIVFELDTPLKDIVATGIKLDAMITKQLLIQIFEKNTPLH
ncbi:MAG: diadenylate cyclase, partial [Lachnospiraceae bacterium]|nr:diadenylate cyclase [Lachnospiraceae bacterium]